MTQPDAMYYQTTPFPNVPREGTKLRGERLNIWAIPVVVILPWLFFCTLYVVASFSMYDEHPYLSWWIFGCCLLCSSTFAVGGTAKDGPMTDRTSLSMHRNTWCNFLSITGVLATILGFSLGLANYTLNTQSYRAYLDMGNFTDVDPRSPGAAYLDAGPVTFKTGSVLHQGYSLGFKDSDTYCVAPITLGDKELAAYDFWAVGINFCNALGGEFRCGTKVDLETQQHGGLRLLRDEDRKKYRAGVEQAVAAFNLTVREPLFFSWTVDPVDDMASMYINSITSLVSAAVGYFCLQLLLVAIVVGLHTTFKPTQTIL